MLCSALIRSHWYKTMDAKGLVRRIKFPSRTGFQCDGLVHFFENRWGDVCEAFEWVEGHRGPVARSVDRRQFGKLGIKQTRVVVALNIRLERRLHLEDRRAT